MLTFLENSTDIKFMKLIPKSNMSSMLFIHGTGMFANIIMIIIKIKNHRAETIVVIVQGMK